MKLIICDAKGDQVHVITRYRDLEHWKALIEENKTYTLYNCHVFDNDIAFNPFKVVFGFGTKSMVTQIDVTIGQVRGCSSTYIIRLLKSLRLRYILHHYLEKQLNSILTSLDGIMRVAPNVRRHQCQMVLAIDAHAGVMLNFHLFQ
ncbi:hypothetical protein MTR_6g088820 [Medicago truncatula]|uniref:DUF223 domain protein n=1 Tax=Medicago truncatula TaxID=3880 RepID=A0A072UMY3_MEDTR|nr:hypothetical protein MTR_6g088820 [Medicago truncatula]